jgi:hypothetical protein
VGGDCGALTIVPTGKDALQTTERIVKLLFTIARRGHRNKLSGVASPPLYNFSGAIWQRERKEGQIDMPVQCMVATGGVHFGSPRLDSGNQNEKIAGAAPLRGSVRSELGLFGQGCGR